MSFWVKIRVKTKSGKPGRVVGSRGPYTTQAAALAFAKLQADQHAHERVGGRPLQVTVEGNAKGVPKGNPRKGKRKLPAGELFLKRNPRGKRKAPQVFLKRNPHRMYRGHGYVKTKEGWKVEAYGKTFHKLGDLKLWLDAHIARESAR